MPKMDLRRTYTCESKYRVVNRAFGNLVEKVKGVQDVY